MLLDYLVVDSMHAGDLGCFADAVGGLFWCEVTCKAWHRNQLNGLLYLNGELKKYYNAKKALGLSSLYPLALSQLKGEGGRPVLKAKAAQCRHVAEFCLQLAYKHKFGTANRPPFTFRGARLRGHEAEHLDALVEMFQGLVNYHRACSAEVQGYVGECIWWAWGAGAGREQRNPNTLTHVLRTHACPCG
jgi:hypothetical protein